jgi:5-methylcytosine-specific restriction endonuclease McrA
MLNENLEFVIESDNNPIERPVAFCVENLNGRLRLVYENALAKAKKYLTAEGELLEAINEIDKTRLFEKFGESHLTPFCVKYLNLSQEVAATFVRVARKGREVPELAKAIANGLNITKAKTIASVITPTNHETWIEKAKSLSKDKLSYEVAKVSPAPFKPEKAKMVSEDRGRIEFELSREVMELQRRAQELVSQKQRTFASLPMTQKALLEFYLKHHDPISKAERAEARKSRGKSRVSNGPKPQNSKTQEDSPDRSRERSPGKPRADVRHALNLRDKGKCQAKMPDGSICGSMLWVDHHHIIRKCDGGADTLDNLVTLCSSHHRMWHDREEGS